MATRAARRATRSAPLAPTPDRLRDPSFAAFSLLRLGYTVAPVLFGVDKFFNWMVDWPRYLWVGWVDFFPGTAQQIMYAVGVIEIVAGLIVFFAPRIGGPLVAAWLAAIITNLVIVGIARDEYWDIALRDFGLLLGAITLSVLAWSLPRRPLLVAQRPRELRRRRRR
jgi:hypothetical protein